MPTYRDDEHLGHKVPLVETDDILKGAVTTDKISDGAVTTEKIADGAVTTDKIKDGAVTGDKIQDHAITPQQLPEDFEVTERMIADQAIGTDKIADNAVTTPKIANQAVTTDKIADQNVTEEKLAPGAVTTEKLADGMIEQLQTITDAEPTPDSVKPLQSGGAASVLGHYIENPEFVRAVTDNEDKVLYGVQADGNFYFGAGCPQQVKDYIQKQIDTIMGVGDVTEKIDTINEMIAFFDQISHDDNIKSLLDTLDVKKVDKEEGKSLIDAEYAEAVHYIESPEFAEIKLDVDGKILEAIYKDGTKLLPAGVKVNGDVEYNGATITTVDNPEFVGAWIDTVGHILMAIKGDGDIYYGCGVSSQIKAYIDEKIKEVSPEGVQDIINFIGEYLGSTTLQELLDKKVNGEYIENPEYIDVKLDADGKILEGINKNGEKVFGILPPQIKQEIESNPLPYTNAMSTYKESQQTVSLKREVAALTQELNSLKSIKNGSTQDTVIVNLRNTNKKKLILNLHKRTDTGTAQSNDVFLPNARNDFSDVRIFCNEEMLPYKVIATGNYDIIPASEFGNDVTGEVLQNSHGTLFTVSSISSWKPSISDDNGKTWNALSDIESGLVNGIIVSITQNDTLLVSKAGVLYRSEYPYTSKEQVLDITSEDGVSYTGCFILRQHVCQHPDGELFLGSYQNEHAVRFYKSTDDGRTWTKIFHNAKYQHCHRIMCDTNQTPSVIYAGADETNGLYYSTDKGETWIDLNENGNLPGAIDQGIIYAGNGFRLLGGETTVIGGHSIIRTTDDINFYPVLSVGEGSYQVGKLPHSNVLFASTSSCQSFLTTQILVSYDNGMSWKSTYNTMRVKSGGTSDGFRFLSNLVDVDTNKPYLLFGCQNNPQFKQKSLKVISDSDTYFAEIVVDVPDNISSIRVESGYLVSDNRTVFNDSEPEQGSILFKLEPINNNLLCNKSNQSFYKGSFNLAEPIKKLGNIYPPITSGGFALSLDSDLPLTGIDLDISRYNAITISFWALFKGNCEFNIVNGIRFKHLAVKRADGSMATSECAVFYIFDDVVGFHSEGPTLDVAKKFDIVLDFNNNEMTVFVNGGGYPVKKPVNLSNYRHIQSWKILEPIQYADNVRISEFIIKNGISSIDELDFEYSNLDDNNN